MDDTTHSQDQPRHEFRIGSLTVPPVGVGTMYFGTTVAADVATTCRDEAADLGATFWDTANNYALWGRWHRRRVRDRHRRLVRRSRRDGP
jgi:aryl-alcohol dehydrogenase-like predicted oxidoreductase